MRGGLSARAPLRATCAGWTAEVAAAAEAAAVEAVAGWAAAAAAAAVGG